MCMTKLCSLLSVFSIILILAPAECPAASKTVATFSSNTPSHFPAAFHAIQTDQKSTVRIDVNPFFNSEINFFSMEIFNGEHLTFKRDHSDERYGENFLLKGHSIRPSGGVVNLIYNRETMAGNIVFPDHTLKIRPFPEGLHILYAMGSDQNLSAITPFYADAGPEEDRVLALVNEERSDRGLSSLEFDEDLHTAARLHSEDMGLNNYFDHNSQDGRTPWDRIGDAGYIGNALGENIAAGQTSPESVVLAWMNSDGHRDNILNLSFCDLGVGYALIDNSRYRHYWTQDFGRKRGVSQCPDVPPDPDPNPAPDPSPNPNPDPENSSGSGCFIQSVQ